jgi:phage protein D
MATYPQYVPQFNISINGQPMPAVVRSSVTSVKFEDGRDAADRVEISIANSDLRFLRSHIRGLGFSPFPTAITMAPVQVADLAPAGTFDLDNTIALSIGYAPDPPTDMFLGEITGVEVSFPNGGMPMMTIVAHDYMNRLQRGKISRGFGFLPDALIAMILSAENLLLPMIDPAIMAASTAIAAVNYIFGGTGRKQAGRSDFEMLQEIAATYDADFWAEGNVLYLSRFTNKDYSPRLTLTWGQNLLDFSPKVSTIGQVAGVGMRFTLREIPLDFLVSVYYDFDRESLGFLVVPGATAANAQQLIGPLLTLIDQPISSPADIVNSALVITNELRQKINNRLTGTGSAVGDTQIRAGAMIRLDGLGPDFSGDYRVVNATHSIDSGGYRTSFQVRKELIP